MNIDRLLEGVQKPGRYIGGEHNSSKKPWDETAVKVCLSYPDIYEIGMSHLGIKILYHLINEQPNTLCERVFAPWPDLEKKLMEQDVPLFSLESRSPLKAFDVLGFSLGYELTFTNFLNILKLGRIPAYSRDRKDDDPIILGGGTSCFNPAPLSKFVDIFFIGEGEEGVLEFLKLFKELKSRETPRMELLQSFQHMEGLYIPSVHNEKAIRKRVVKNLETSYYPVKQIVPFIQTIHDRVAIEIMRGCPNKCRFCQARFLYHPLRLRSKKRILELAKQSLKSTGYDEVSFLSLSSSNHPDLCDMISALRDEYKGKGINVAVPSLRVDDRYAKLPNLIASNRKTGLTFAPESADLKLRQRLNKEIEPKMLFKIAKEAYISGWKRLKLYFMVGFSGENNSSLDDIASFAYQISYLKKEVDGKRAELTLSINSFIPKPHTPFQWLGIQDKAILIEKRDYLRKKIRDKKIKMDFHDIDISYLEAALARGDEALGDVIYGAWQGGAKFDSWREHLRMDIWEKAFSSLGFSLGEYATRRYDISDRLPWDFIDIGISKEMLCEEAKRARVF